MDGENLQYIHGVDPTLLLVRRELSPFLSDLGILARRFGLGGGDGKDERAEEQQASEDKRQVGGHLESGRGSGKRIRGGSWPCRGAVLYAAGGGTESSIGEGDKRILGKEMCDQLPCIDPSPDSSQGPYAEFIGIAVE